MLELLGGVVIFAAGVWVGTHYPDAGRRLKRWWNDVRNRGGAS